MNTPVADLPAKWREIANNASAETSNKALTQEVVCALRAESIAYRRCAYHLEAALATPAVEGGLPNPELLEAARNIAAECERKRTVEADDYDPHLHELADFAIRRLATPERPCCMCGKKVDTRENGTPGAELTDGRWTCGPECFEKATEQPGSAVQGEFGPITDADLDAAREPVPPAPAAEQVDAVTKALDTLTQYSAEHGHPADFERAITTLSVLAKSTATQPEAPAAEQVEQRSTHRVHQGAEWLPCYCASTMDHPIGFESPQPEARGVEGITEAMRSEMHAVVQRAGGYRIGLLDEMYRAALATSPNPVRAEQPEGKGALARGVAQWVIAALGDLTSDYAAMTSEDVEQALLANVEHAPALSQQPAAPAAPVGVDEAARALVAKIEAIHADPGYQGVWLCAHNHGQPYTGPSYEAELAALTAALAGKRS